MILEILSGLFMVWLFGSFAAWVFMEEIRSNTDPNEYKSGLFIDAEYQDLTPIGRHVYQAAHMQITWAKRLCSIAAKPLYNVEDREED